MDPVGIRTNDGVRYVSIEKLRALVAAGKVPADRAIITLDGGVSWVTAAEVSRRQAEAPPSRIASPARSSSAAPPPPNGAPVAPPGLSGLVIASFVLSGLSVIFLCVSGIPAIVCAALAMQLARNRRLAGTALAVSIAATIVTTGGWMLIAAMRPGLLQHEGASRSGDSAGPSSVGGSGAGSRRPARSEEPESQRRFVEIVSAAGDAYRSARNEVAESASRDSRRRALSKDFRSATVTGWVGRIKEISTNMDGKGVLAVSVGPDITLSTWNNELSDIASGTLIDKSSAVYGALMDLSVGDRVVFSGSFLPSDEDHFAEQSITLHGSMVDPAFTFDFRTIEPAGR